jgi:succinate dehydrogenase / fumarate reductase membrane anchor subunit
MRIETPLARARGTGSARDGAHHWWWQRITAILLVPLSLWFVASIWWLVIGGASYAAFADWLSGPVAAILMILFVGATFYHLHLGVQTVIEDYVHNKLVQWTLLIKLTLASLVFGLATVYAVVVGALKG